MGVETDVSDMYFEVLSSVALNRAAFFCNASGSVSGVAGQVESTFVPRILKLRCRGRVGGVNGVVSRCRLTRSYRSLALPSQDKRLTVYFYCWM
jgi:hypothetical protein